MKGSNKTPVKKMFKDSFLHQLYELVTSPVA